MNRFEKGLIKYLGKEKLEKIQKIRVGIAGAGGLGSNCAFNLVRSGFKNFRIIDFDVIEESNLNRQFYFSDQLGRNKVEALRENLLRINPDLNLEVFVERIEDSNIDKMFESCDVVVEAFDRAEYKRLIVENYMKSKKLLVAASGLAGWGKSDEIKTNRINDSFYVIGDLVSEVSEEMPPISPRVNIAAAKQADVILCWSMSYGEEEYCE